MLPLLSISLKTNSEYIKTLTIFSRCQLSVKWGSPPAYKILGGNKRSDESTQLNTFKKWLVIYSVAFASMLLLLEIFVLELLL